MAAMPDRPEHPAPEERSRTHRWAALQPAGAAVTQIPLFEVPEREIGRGEFRGLEFVHVRARRIINEVPDRSPVPFRYTINAYRGCSHACTYCFARPTHAYLDLDPSTEFDRVIVVKTNAVERLRAELRPKRWRGDPIAMGTNTDPYQRAGPDACGGQLRHRVEAAPRVR